ncbi:FHA domain-containing protein [Zhihengliuella salsuginis]|uniref:FHA domain-containing protein n=1 Tax=Zhihengliuella salsuginis TaxID=578222 RepID=A0ABQ3GKM0_9MICC|nr:FHA domain-containing protein [Zhihengliuella salsuginis]GHD08881.1 hypothetical protein GCM10008096_21050 [Zhihengliuella salsuginis]
MGAQEGLGEPTQTPAERAAQTTNISLPPSPEAPAIDHTLSAEERDAVAALPSGSALLIAHEGPNRGARFLLDEEVTTAGRHPEADIFLDDVTVSRRHAEFRRTEAGFDVADAGSLNGTYVNHDRVDAVALRTGAEVRIGKFRLTFYAGTQASQGL